ncbi:uncharacterized protein LOC128133320 isoform X2 [Lactuca sativa]|uniref:uncharacterized protein LOC128133319 isoform X2 n=1 Tax=Lactuca sativa TaxID=4236 RepID=UPI0022AFC9C7|nr:uncharacterized protein LOC128133319 isoform X2 [Lactuca sativa]XP_052626531.1 uncharacterized protein LOC111899276 isoform X2 [Lactuca sativa]XP_052626533.1 uncharacterized protein LOC128133320 isoform X2 [Lactuca sativa]
MVWLCVLTDSACCSSAFVVCLPSLSPPASNLGVTLLCRSQDGDIININVTVYLDVTEQCLERGISVCKDVSILMTRVRFRHMGNNRYCSMPNLQLRIRAYGSKKADN